MGEVEGKTAATVRFSVVVGSCGAPEVYLPLSDPKHDKGFMRAVKDQRVVTLKQEPTGTKKDFGTVGFLEERYVTYLVFPKSLKDFAEKRIVGIKYDELQQASIATPAEGAARKAVAKPKMKVERRERKPLPPPPPPKPKPRLYEARVRLTAVIEVDVPVRALDEREARDKVLEAARAKADFKHAQPEITLISLRPTGETSHGD